MANNPTVSNLLKSKEVTDEQVSGAVNAVLASPKIGLFKLALGCVVDLTASVQADRHASAVLKEPTAKTGSKRAAIKSAILLAHPVKG